MSLGTNVYLDTSSSAPDLGGKGSSQHSSWTWFWVGGPNQHSLWIWFWVCRPSQHGLCTRIWVGVSQPARPMDPVLASIGDLCS